MINDFFRGASYFFRGASLISRRSVRTWAFLPVFLTFLVYAAAVWVALWLLDGELGNLRLALPDWMQSSIAWVEGWMPDWLEVVLIWGPIAILVYFFFTLSFVAVAALVASPFNGMLAEAVEKRLGGETPQLSWGQLFKRLPYILIQETKKILYYVLWAIPFGIVSLILVFTPLSPLAPGPWLLFSAWMLALEFSDFPMDNNGLHFREMRRRLRTRKWLYLGFGATALLASTIPIVALIVVPSGVAGATAIWFDVMKNAPKTR